MHPWLSYLRPQLSLHTNIMLASGKSSAKLPTGPCKIGKINEFFALSTLLIFHADNNLYHSMACAIGASRHWASIFHYLWWHRTVTHLLLTYTQPIPRRATGEQWSDAPTRTFHKALLSRLMNPYSIHWLPGLHKNAISSHHSPLYLICLECVIGCEVERGVVLVHANQVWGYGGTDASHPGKVLYLTVCTGLESVQSWPCGVGL